jgi:hypothetical protein
MLPVRILFLSIYNSYNTISIHLKKIKLILRYAERGLLLHFIKFTNFVSKIAFE